MSTPPATLDDIQRAIAQAVMRPLTRGEGMGRASAGAAAAIIKPNDRLTSFERLQIYNQQYWWRILGNFSEDFPGLRAVLGERRFDWLAVAYLESCGSTSWTMRNLGNRLESFLQAHPELTAPRERLALDMARVEWARTVAFDEEERPPVQAAKLAKAPPALLRLGLQPYLTLLELAHPIDELLQKLRRRSEETASVSNAVIPMRPRPRRALAATPSAGPIHLAVHRVEYSVYFKRLDPAAYRILVALREGIALEAACEQAFPADAPPEQSAAQVQQWFAAWMKFGWLTAPAPLRARAA